MEIRLAGPNDAACLFEMNERIMDIQDRKSRCTESGCCIFSLVSMSTLLMPVYDIMSSKFPYGITNKAVNMKREKAAQELPDLSFLEEDLDLIRQVQQSREDRKQGRIYGKEAGLEYLQAKVKEFEHGQNI